MNLGLAIRDCYVLGDGQVTLYVFDPANVLSEKAETIRRFSSYATDHFGSLHVIHTQDDALNLIRRHDGRIVCATSDESTATELNRFAFHTNDLLVFGNEYYGLPDEVLELADQSIIIPMLGQPYVRPDLSGKVKRVGAQRCLGVSASLSIILYVALSHITGYRDWRLLGDHTSPGTEHSE